MCVRNSTMLLGYALLKKKTGIAGLFFLFKSSSRFNLRYNTWEDPHISGFFSSELVGVFIMTFQSGFVWKSIDHHDIPVLRKFQ